MLADRGPDILRKLLQMTVEKLMSAEADVLCGAGYRERSEDRQNHSSSCGGLTDGWRSRRNRGMRRCGIPGTTW